MKKIILDTNFLLIPVQFKVDIFSEIERVCLFRYKLYVVDKTIDELNKVIEKGNMKNKLAAKVALALIRQKKIDIIKTGEGKVDDLIVGLLDKDYILATQDAELRKRALKKGNKVIFLRVKNYLVLS
ncbi:MAG: hypothetical protein KKC75_00090 [Nanoarchaeota archaeon]|nr:hypothetical protein [Nanoarchaeota archaeon]MBU1005570.1 hypothetical protein [Nanoarchaeota archaeon]MBU1946047.1 hypothetical protein [Nanoarchaeota archaeon]